MVPSVLEAVCVNGQLTEPTLTLPTTDGIAYTSDVPEPYVPGRHGDCDSDVDPGRRRLARYVAHRLERNLEHHGDLHRDVR